MPELRPPVNLTLVGRGRVAAHERVVDSLGRFHGLYRLAIDGMDVPDAALWTQLLPANARVAATFVDIKITKRLLIFYKLGG